MPLTYSIIAPIFNEFDNIPELYRRVSEVMDSTGEPWEFILVDDVKDVLENALLEPRKNRSSRKVVLKSQIRNA